MKLVKGVNDLKTVNPILADEWDTDRNDIGPDEVTSKSGKKVWWKCPENHCYISSIGDRTRGRGCPYCSGRLAIKGKTDLATKNPELVGEWDTDRNDIGPDEVASKSKKKVWWKCPEGHRYQAIVANRSKGSGCPYCSGRLAIKGETDFATKYPELVGEWDTDRNDIGPDEVASKSNKKVWWKCPEGHHYETMIETRSKGSGCPYCAGRRAIKGKTDLATMYPVLASEWDTEKNSIGPDEVTSKSNKKVWWKCPEGHHYEATISRRTKGDGCPYCSGRLAIKGKTDLATKNPELAGEWDTEKNSIGPDEVTSKSNKKVWWKCPEGHHYEATICNRAKGNRCPYCAGKVAIKGETDLLSRFPELALDWNYEKNDVKPEEFTAFSKKKVYWKCHICGHEAFRSIRSYVMGNGCSKCKH